MSVLFVDLVGSTARAEGPIRKTCATTCMRTPRLREGGDRLQTESTESAIEWASRAIEIARRTRGRKYEACSLSLYGQAVARAARRDEALASLRLAVSIADELIGPPARWQARAALAHIAYAMGDDETASTSFDEASTLIETFAATLAPKRAGRFLAAPAIEEIRAAQAGQHAGARATGRRRAPNDERSTRS